MDQKARRGTKRRSLTVITAHAREIVTAKASPSVCFERATDTTSKALSPAQAKDSCPRIDAYVAMRVSATATVT